jgi:hypothetical protein
MSDKLQFVAVSRPQARPAAGRQAKARPTLVPGPQWLRRLARH